MINRILSMASMIISVLLISTSGSLVLAEDKKTDGSLHGQKSSELIVYLADKVSVDYLEKIDGFKLRRSFASAINAHVLSGSSVVQADELQKKLQQDPNVVAVFNNRHWGASTSWSPENFRVEVFPGIPVVDFSAYIQPFAIDDIYYPPGYDIYGQWHLNSIYWTNVNAPAAWQQGLLGEDVVIGIVDSGVETSHPDLSVDLSLSYDFVEGNADANPDSSLGFPNRRYFSHGTAVAGVAAAIGGNGRGVTGAAPKATIAALRIPLGFTYAAYPSVPTFEDAVVDAIHFGAGSVAIKNHSYGSAMIYLPWEAEKYALQQTATENNMIHVFSAANNRSDVNSRTRAIPETIIVAGIGAAGKFATYSNYGASVLVAAPTSDGIDDGLSTDILTTDMQGINGVNMPAELEYTCGICADEAFFFDVDYRENFGGTSSSAPLVSGLLALAKQVRPEMDVRWAKHLLIGSSRMVDSNDSSPESFQGWRKNAANCWFNPNYGFGVPDAGRLAELASDSELGLTALQKVDSGLFAIEDSAFGRTNFHVHFPGNATSHPVEEVGVSVNIELSHRNDLEIILVSPSGTESRLLNSEPESPNTGAGEPIVWTYWSNAFWGEQAEGGWSLKVGTSDRKNIVKISSARMHWRMGELQKKGESLTLCDQV